jgi:prepilin-type N-terminal cleavage/methylation domain-containing protein
MRAAAFSSKSFRIAVRMRACRRAFSLVEVLVAVTLMSVIVLGLLAMFGQTQRAFRTGITQVDVLEAGRSAMDLMARELAEAKPTSLPFSTNFYAGWNNYFLPQALPGDSASGGSQWRTNIQQNVLFTVRDNQTWTGIGYAVEYSANNYIGTLYRYETNASALDPGLVARLAVNAFNAKATRAHLLDGVVELRVRAYDTAGRLISPYNIPPKAANNVLAYNNIPGELSYNYYFVSNAAPAYVDLELGVLEAKTAERARNLSAAAQYNFLTNQAAHVQIFRQRIPIRNVDPSVYQ